MRDELFDGAVIRGVEVTSQSVPRIPRINHQDTVRALQKAGFRIVWQGKHVVMGAA